MMKSNSIRVKSLSPPPPSPPPPTPPTTTTTITTTIITTTTNSYINRSPDKCNCQEIAKCRSAANPRLFKEMLPTHSHCCLSSNCNHCVWILFSF